MIWLTWRQLRTALVASFGVLAAVVVVLALTGPGIADDYASGLAACTATGGDDCETFFNTFVDDHDAQFLALTMLVLLVPPLVGIFWGAPLVSRELESGTHRLVWNQSVPRTRWLAVRLGVTGLAAMAATALASLAVTWWSSTIDLMPFDGFFPRLGSLVFDARGVAPVGYAAFAFALGVVVGMLVRRALPAMALTLAIFVAVQLLVGVFVRPHLLAPTRSTVEISPSVVDGLQQAGEGEARLMAKTEPGVWLLSSTTIDASGNAVDSIPLSTTTGPCAPSASPRDGFADCLADIAEQGYRFELTFHGPDRFWPLQWVEAGCYLAAALALTGFAFWWLRRRLC